MLAACLTVREGHNEPDHREQEPGEEETGGEAENCPVPRSSDHRGEKIFQVSGKKVLSNLGNNSRNEKISDFCSLSNQTPYPSPSDWLTDKLKGLLELLSATKNLYMYIEFLFRANLWMSTVLHFLRKTFKTDSKFVHLYILGAFLLCKQLTCAAPRSPRAFCRYSICRVWRPLYFSYNGHEWH